ncbi:MAG: ABC transporter permease [Desulfuromonas sp.]|nr:ABC transporter permease [Desulfuromonas sp.]
MIYWLRFALRSVLRRRRRTLVTFVSVGFGVAMLIVLGAIMVGVNDTMVKNAVALQTGHLAIESPPLDLAVATQRLNALQTHLPAQQVQVLLPRFSMAVLLSHQQAQQAVQVYLVDPALEQRWSPVPKTIRTGQWLAEAGDGIVIGLGAAQALGVMVGDSLDVVTAEHHTTLSVVGIFQTGVQTLDQRGGYLSITTAKAYRLDTGVRIQGALFAPPATDLVALRRQLLEYLPAPLTATSWQQKLPEVEQLVNLNLFSMQIMIALVIIILGFGVANSLLISVMDRYRYYGILKAIGVRPREVIVTVVGEAMVVCVGAGLLGTFLGVLISLVWGEIGLDISHYTSYNPHFSIDAVIYPRLQPIMVFLPQALALLSGVVASVWPAMVAARRQVSSSMREL